MTITTILYGDAKLVMGSIGWCNIGSLGQNQHEPSVQNMIVKSANLTNTQNGVRIKSWARPSNEFARNVIFQHVNMMNVHNPIIIDQNYCPSGGCPYQERYFEGYLCKCCLNFKL